jgi:hypothetical protein
MQSVRYSSKSLAVHTGQAELECISKIKLQPSHVPSEHSLGSITKSSSSSLLTTQRRITVTLRPCLHAAVGLNKHNSGYLIQFHSFIQHRYYQLYNTFKGDDWQLWQQNQFIHPNSQPNLLISCFTFEKI